MRNILGWLVFNIVSFIDRQKLKRKLKKLKQKDPFTYKH